MVCAKRTDQTIMSNYLLQCANNLTPRSPLREILVAEIRLEGPNVFYWRTGGRLTYPFPSWSLGEWGEFASGGVCTLVRPRDLMAGAVKPLENTKLLSLHFTD